MEVTSELSGKEAVFFFLLPFYPAGFLGLLLLTEHPLAFLGLDHELIPLFEDTYSVFIHVKQNGGDMILYLMGRKWKGLLHCFSLCRWLANSG